MCYIYLLARAKKKFLLWTCARIRHGKGLSLPIGDQGITKIFRPDSSLYNEDLAPTSPQARTWTTYNYIALWFSMSMEVTTFMLASSLIAGGMNWKQAVFTILLGNLIVLIPMVLNAHAGAKYGIPFPVFVRASFGTRGANIPAILRAIVACGWFGIQSWIGGESIAAIVNVIWPSSVTNPSIIWISFLSFWALNMVVIWCGLESIRFLQSVSAPFLLVMSLLLLAFMTHKAGGFGPLLNMPSRFPTKGAGVHFFFLALTGMVGNWATLSLNIPDFTRFAKSQESQIVGQGFGLPVAMTLYSFIGIACTSASVVVFGEAIWNPVTLLVRFHQPYFAFLALISILIATLNVNIGANVVGPSNDFSNLLPRYISFRTGGLITGVLGLMVQPWKLMASHTNYIGWLVSYSGLLGPVAGIMVTDYFFLRKTRLDLQALYQRGGAYQYSSGFNLRAVFALLGGVFAAFIGVFVPALRPLYDYAWFVGCFVSAALYMLLMGRHSVRTASSSSSQNYSLEQTNETLL
jgi:NCS1 family nucleobase:cation symporter-1